MLKPPKIVITNIDEDPAIRRERKRKKITELCGKWRPQGGAGGRVRPISEAISRIRFLMVALFSPLAWRPLLVSSVQHTAGQLDYGNQQILLRVRNAVGHNHHSNYCNAVLSAGEDSLRGPLWPKAD